MYGVGTAVVDQKGSPSVEGLPVVYFLIFGVVIDFAFGVRRAIRIAEKKIAAAVPGSWFLFMIPTPC
jgi:hypothetical protein